jgi:hypothetical protein
VRKTPVARGETTGENQWRQNKTARAQDPQFQLALPIHALLIGKKTEHTELRPARIGAPAYFARR